MGLHLQAAVEKTREETWNKIKGKINSLTEEVNLFINAEIIPLTKKLESIIPEQLFNEIESMEKQISVEYPNLSKYVDLKVLPNILWDQANRSK